MKKINLVFASLLVVFMSVFITGCNSESIKLDFIVDDAIYKTVELGENASFPQTPSKTGYTFDGWYWDEDIWEQPLTISQMRTGQITENGTVYAKWVRDNNSGSNDPFGGGSEDNDSSDTNEDQSTPSMPKFTITLDSGLEPVEVTFNDNYSLPVPTDSAKTFMGWMYGGRQVTDYEGNSLSVYEWTNDVSFTAKWQTFGIYLENDNREGGTVSCSYGDFSAIPAGTEVTLTATPNLNYEFNGFYNSNGSWITMNNVYTFTMPRAIKRVTVKWKLKTRKLTVEYFGDYAETPGTFKVDGTEGECFEKEYEHYERVYLTATSSNKYYIFMGWFNSNGYQLSDDTSYNFRIENDRHIYAKWIKLELKIDKPIHGGNIHVFYDSTNNMFASSGTATYAPEPNTEYRIVADLSKNTHTWAGFYNSVTEELITMDSEYIFTVEYDSIYIEARWFNATVKVSSIDTLGGKVSIDNPLILGEKVTITAHKNIGYVWDGWYLNQEKVSDSYNYEITVGQEQQEYIAKWTKCNGHIFNNCYCICGQEAEVHEANPYCVHEEFNTVYFGSYPQTQVKDSTMISKLNNYMNENHPEGKLYEYPVNFTYGDELRFSDMMYADIVYEGQKYRVVTMSNYRPWISTLSPTEENSSQDTTKWKLDTRYWFKFEPIKWNIIGKENGKYLLMSDSILDAQPYQAEVYKRDDGFYYNATYTGYLTSSYLQEDTRLTAWYASTLRKWLNNSFYNTAFNDAQNDFISLHWSSQASSFKNPNTSSENKLNLENLTSRKYVYDADLGKDVWIEPEYNKSDKKSGASSVNIFDRVFIANRKTLVEIQNENKDNLIKKGTDYSSIQGLDSTAYLMRAQSLSDNYEFRSPDHPSDSKNCALVFGYNGTINYQYNLNCYAEVSGVVPMLVFTPTTTG